MKQAVGLQLENGVMNPGRWPWADMKQAVGLKTKACTTCALLPNLTIVTPKASLIPAQGRSPGFIPPKAIVSAEGATHPGSGQRRAKSLIQSQTYLSSNSTGLS